MKRLILIGLGAFALAGCNSFGFTIAPAVPGPQPLPEQVFRCPTGDGFYTEVGVWEAQNFTGCEEVR
jgi:hypothetical protein